MKNKISLFIAILFLTTFLLSCGLQNQMLRKQIENEEKAWTELGISNYRIKVVDSSIWYQIELDIVVKDSVVESMQSTCGHAPMDYEATNCKNKISRLDANEYTLEGLFKLLQTSEQDFERSYGNIKGVDWHECLSVSFDEQYHFPTKISFNHPQVMDEDYTITVSDFEIIE
ncbi:MAG: hypothetical protein KF758_18620 [Anaerolineales bacterium]|nr:hypothetical protein [Anaerolineales bacterium]